MEMSEEGSELPELEMREGESCRREGELSAAALMGFWTALG
jgi:hypothetical protein